MKSLLPVLASALVFTAAASAAESCQQPSISGIVPTPEANLYAAAPPTPEPSRSVLLLLGCMGLIVRRRR